ncbi:transposase, partial [Meridianimarinicoccus zhengii]|uniref:transposase n=1 Tax=Meridianimarinicoccus zhengii TaxID=2056810 RepID=UPI001F400692
MAGVLDLERDGKMGVHIDGSGGVGVSRLEVIEGPSGRRRRTKAERARIAAESMMPGAKVADVARKHGTTRWQVYDWRKQLRKAVKPRRIGKRRSAYVELRERAVQIVAQGHTHTEAARRLCVSIKFVNDMV